MTLDDTSGSARSSRVGMLALVLKTRGEFYQAWMPFIRGGGLFVPTTRAYELGEEVFLLVTLPEGASRVPMRGKVVWINPTASAGRVQGIGVGFEGEAAGEDVRSLAATTLAGASRSSRPTNTL